MKRIPQLVARSRSERHYWKEHYDLLFFPQKNWATVGSKLVDKPYCPGLAASRLSARRFGLKYSWFSDPDRPQRQRGVRPSYHGCSPAGDSGRLTIEQHLVNGRYTVIERIGKGAMGVVYKCHDSVLDRIVAVKQMLGQINEDEQLRRRFAQEARSAARLNHRNIITIYELHDAGPDLAIVMEFLEGVDLATLLKRWPPLPLEVKLNLMAQVCDGLDYAHQKGIVHRDIKPANLHVSPAGVVKILDFGIARITASSMTATGSLVGTPDYMSPEQVMSDTLDARSDLFAVGAVLYELLADARPFEADSITALLVKIVREPHVPLRQRAPHLPAAAIDIVERLLSKEREKRPSSAREVREALQAISTERPLFDASTVAMLSNVVAEETIRGKTSRPVAPSTGGSAPPSASSSARDESSSKLASLAIERGRALRETGDLAGAMKVFRSVLELAPGNSEALRELEEVEHAFSRLSANGRLAAEIRAAVPATGSDGSQKLPVPPAAGHGDTGAVPMAVPAAGQAKQLKMIAAAVAAVVVLGVGAFALLSRRDHRAAESAPTAPPAASAQPAQGGIAGQPGAGPSSAPAASAAPTVQRSPALSAAPSTPGTIADPASVAPSPRVSTSPPPAPAARRTAPAPAAPANVPPGAIPTVAAAPPPPEPAPVPAAPAAAVAEPPTAAPPAAAAPAIAVRHLHGRSLRLARGHCDGNLELLADGLHYQATSSSDGRKDDDKIRFSDVEDFEVDGDRIRIETDQRAWEFGAPKDALRRIEQVLKANKKEKK